MAESALLRVVEQVMIPAGAAGVLNRLKVEEGDLVKSGDLVAAIDDAEVKLLHKRAVLEHELSQYRSANDISVRSAEKAVAFARQELKRFQAATADLPGSISASELEESRVAFEQATLDLEQSRRDRQQELLTARLKQADRDIAEHQIDIRRIKSPLSGMVVEILKRPGAWVEPGENVLRVMRIDRLRAEGLIAIGHGLQDLKGSAVDVSVIVASGPTHQARGKVVFVSPEINPVSGKVRVRAEFDNPNGRLRPGMRATMVIHPTVNTRNALR